MVDAVYSGIADYLGRQRELKSLSQEALAEQLAANSSVFDGIDGLAISRWERGVVNPSIERQVRLMEFFDDEPYLLLGNASYELKQLPSLGAFHKWMQQNLLFNHVMGGHPYSTDEETNFDKNGSDHEHLSLWVRLVCRYNENLTRGRESWSEEQLQALLVLLEEYDSAAEDKLLELLQQLEGTDASRPMQALRNPIGAYDFETAAEDLKSIIENIAPLIKKTPGAGDTGRPDDLEEQLRELLGLLNDYDSAAEDKLFEILEQVRGNEIEDRLQSLRKPIGQYDLEAAGEKLETLIDELSQWADDNG